jgi:2-C-methyl-D-erythritol 4-phosphate cytidylyltransferase
MVPVCDTLRTVRGGTLVAGSTTRRADLVGIQTPQGFRRESLLAALKEAGEELPDDAEALLRRGLPVAVVEGDRGNVKLTTAADLALLAAVLLGREEGSCLAGGFDPVEDGR